MRLSRLAHALPLEAVTALVVIPTANADPFITLESDWGTLSVEAWFSGYPGSPNYWSDTYEGPVWGGVELQIQPIVYTEGGLPHSLLAIAKIWEPASRREDSIGAFTTIQPTAGDMYGHCGRAHVDGTWSFVVGAESAQFSANASAWGGSLADAGFTLYDETDDDLVADLSQGPGGSVCGELRAYHEYTMNFFSHSVALGSGDPFGNLEFYTNATIVPEPSTAALLLLAGLAAIRRRLKTRQSSPSQDCM